MISRACSDVRAQESLRAELAIQRNHIRQGRIQEKRERLEDSLRWREEELKILNQEIQSLQSLYETAMSSLRTRKLTMLEGLETTRHALNNIAPHN